MMIYYHDKKEGIIKKQMKFNSQTQEDLDIIISNINKYKKIYLLMNMSLQK